VTFAELDTLYILAPVLIALLVIQWRKRKHYMAHSLASHPIINSMRPSYLRLLPKVLVLAGVVVAGVTLLEPRITFKEGVTELQGLDIVLVVDLSSSMQEILGGWEEHKEFYEARSKGGDRRELPMPETRMQAVQRALLDFVSRRQDDRLALVTFSENSYVVSPLTTDRTYLEKYIEMIDPAILIGEGMTAIGEGIDTAIDLFRREEDPETKNKVVVVFSDGEHNFGRDPIDVLGEARFYGYRVYLIGVELGAEITRKEKVQLLISAVGDSGGQYFDARNKRQLEEAYTSIDKLEKGVFVQKTLETNVPAYQSFAVTALILLMLGLGLGSIPYFVEIS